MAKESVKSTYKSDDTEEWLDKVWTRPIGYWWARLFERLNVHPNVVTVLSMIIGASAALFLFMARIARKGRRALRSTSAAFCCWRGRIFMTVPTANWHA